MSSTSVLKQKAARSPEVYVTKYQSTRFHIPQDCNSNLWYRQSLTCHKYYLQLLTFYRTQVLFLPHALVKC